MRHSRRWFRRARRWLRRRVDLTVRLPVSNAKCLPSLSGSDVFARGTDPGVQFRDRAQHQDHGERPSALHSGGSSSFHRPARLDAAAEHGLAPANCIPYDGATRTRRWAPAATTTSSNRCRSQGVDYDRRRPLQGVLGLSDPRSAPQRPALSRPHPRGGRADLPERVQLLHAGHHRHRLRRRGLQLPAIPASAARPRASPTTRWSI